MDIRTKLALALVSMSLISMLVLGTFAYQTAAELLWQVSERQLDALAESKQHDLEKVIQGWRDRVELIRSRTRLRELLARTASEDDPKIRAEMHRIVTDAVGSIQNVDRVTIFDVQGEPLVTVGSTNVDVQLKSIAVESPDAVHYGGTVILGRDRVFVRFHAAMQRGEKVIGAVETIFEAEDLLTVAHDYAGLGESGETLIVMRPAGIPSGPALVLTTLRHDPDLRELGLDEAPYLIAALDGDDEVFRSGIRDYRGADIWCATRTLPNVDWGLVVKIDSAEEARRLDLFRSQMVDLGLALGAVGILAGTFLGFRLGRPLLDLKDMVGRIRAGERHLRADANSSDEIGFLAEALNDLFDEHQPPR